MERLLERELLPDLLIRQGIRRLLRRRLRDEDAGSPEERQARHSAFVEKLSRSPIAIETNTANKQHYEVPTSFYQHVLGPHMKYSCGYWREDTVTLEQSEETMLRLTSERAELKDGQSVLELGCGWGSLSLWIAAHYPLSHVTAVSNSRTQKAYIDEEARKRGLTNIRVVTADMNVYEPETGHFDRVISIEMFEHMRNYEKLLEKVARALARDGKLFIHVFVHKEFAYSFDVKDASDWMSEYFFTGGIMPSDRLLLYFQKDVLLERHWHVSGTHYQKTSHAWLAQMDAKRNDIMPIFEKTYGAPQAQKWWVFWRLFFMSCAELWGFRGGSEWFVSHYLFHRR